MRRNSSTRNKNCEKEFDDPSLIGRDPLDVLAHTRARRSLVRANTSFIRRGGVAQLDNVAITSFS